MKISVECLPCLVNQATRLVKTHLKNDDAAQLSLIKKVMQEISISDDQVSAPYLAHRMLRLLKDALQDPDPYRGEKLYYNSEMLKLEEEFSDLIKSSDDRLETAIKLAAAGNIIDFGPGHDLTRNRVLKVIRQTLAGDFHQETFALLKTDLANARKILYLGDNAGEIVFDKLFIRTLKEAYPNLAIDFATRGSAVLNDVTEEDAYYVGMDVYARIINNGTDIPGTVLEYCSEDFKRVFDNADLIIAKGQGNFESLYGSGRSHLYYIFLCKCHLFVERFGARQNEVILMRE